MRALSDAALVAKAESGDNGAYETLAARYRDLVFGLCQALLGDRADAEDTTQQTLVRGLERLGSLRSPDRFGPWIFSIARNECRQITRRRAREERRSDRCAPERDAATAPAAATETRDMAEIARRELWSLPEETTFMFLLSSLDGLNSSRIGEMVGMRPDAVRARLSRARARLAPVVANGVGEPSVPSQSTGAREDMHTYHFSNAGQGGGQMIPFADEAAQQLYGELYEGSAIDGAASRNGLDGGAVEAYIRVWERHKVVERAEQGFRFLVPVILPEDARRLQPWTRALGRRWAEEASASLDELREIAEAAAPGGHVDAALEALTLWYPLVGIHAALRAAGVIAPAPERPGGHYYLRGWRHPQGYDELPPQQARACAFGERHLGDWGGTALWATAWVNVRNQPHVVDGLQGQGSLELVRALITFRADPPRRAEAIERLPDHSRFASREDLLDRLIGWDIITSEEPHRLLLPLFSDGVAARAIDHARGVGRAVAAFAQDGRETLAEIVRSCSFADCHPADVSFLANSGGGLSAMLESDCFPELPEACFGQRGLFLKDYSGPLVPDQ